MREFIRVAALGLALIATPAFAEELPTTGAGVPCVPLEVAIQRLEAAGLEVLGEGHARFTENTLLFVRDKGLVFAVTVVKGCVVPTTLIVGEFKPEYGI